jgi:hypothetical protein
MEYLVFAIILYFILQTAGNLVYILRGGAKTPSASSAVRGHDWKGPSPRQEMEGFTDHPTFWAEDVDEASWKELED